MSETTTTRYFKGHGQVQRVMFRQTIIRAAQRRGLVAGASNSKSDINEVTFTLSGDNGKIEEILQFFREKSIFLFQHANPSHLFILLLLELINSWGARITSFTEEETGTNATEHQVNTSNVDTFRWREDVGMYL